MQEKQCSKCGKVWPEEETLEREDNHEIVCIPCSGLLTEEEIICRYDEGN